MVNDVDSGYNGWWAIDNYTLHIQIWQEPNGTFLFVLTYHGTSTTYPGVYSPGAQDAVEGARGVARMDGYIAGWATGTLAPTLSTRGQLGSYDYGGLVSDLTTVNHYGNGAAPPNSVDWLGAYLSGNAVSGESYALVYTYHADDSQAAGPQVWIDANNVPAASSGDVVVSALGAVQPPPEPVPGSRSVVDARATVVNDVDSGYNGWWAIDNYTLHIQIWQEPNGTFLFVLTYHGTSTTYPGVYSPGAQDAVEGARGVARMDGYIAGWATGTLAPTLSTRGQLGSYDYGGLVSDLTTVNHYGNGAAPPNSVDWLGAYLSGNAVSGESYALVYTYHADDSQAAVAQVWIDANNVPSSESGDIVL